MRKAGKLADAQEDLRMLQWGRNLIVAEGQTLELETAFRVRFNGAAT